MALCWFWDQEYTDEGSKLCGVNETWMAIAEIPDASVNSGHGQDTV